MDDPITPPPELIEQWMQAHSTKYDLARQAAQWGADQELEACVNWLDDTDCEDPQEVAQRLRAARRPKPPSLKEQALAVLEEEPGDAKELLVFDTDQVNLIRRALEALPND